LPACTSCHTNKAKHAGKVACQSCHTNLAKGHHRAGKVSTRACSDCHTKAGIHASATVKGAAFTCGTCHEGTVHGVLTLPGPGRCIECHQEAPKHAGDMACTDCHWPAAHSTKPDASVFGSYEPMTVSPAAVPPSDGEPRDWFVKTGMDVLALIAAAAALVTLGLLLRRRRP